MFHESRILQRKKLSEQKEIYSVQKRSPKVHVNKNWLSNSIECDVSDKIYAAKEFLWIDNTLTEYQVAKNFCYINPFPPQVSTVLILIEQ